MVEKFFANYVLCKNYTVRPLSGLWKVEGNVHTHMGLALHAKYIQGFRAPLSGTLSYGLSALFLALLGSALDKNHFHEKCDLVEDCSFSFSFGNCWALIVSFCWRLIVVRWSIRKCHVPESVMAVWQFKHHLMTCWNYVRSMPSKCSSLSSTTLSVPGELLLHKSSASCIFQVPLYLRT